MPELPELSDLFKNAVGDIPPFDVAALVGKQRHRRQLQMAGGASALAAVAAIVAVLIVVSGGSNDNVAVGTRNPHSNDSSTTYAPSTTSDLSTTTGSTGTTVPGSAPAQTTVPGTGSTTVPDRRAPRASDFTGSFTAQPTTVNVGGVGVSLDLTITNATDHSVEPSLGSLTTGVAIVCFPSGPDGQMAPLQPDVNLWFVTSPALAPGEQGGRSATFMPSATDVGTETCGGAIVSSSDGWQTIYFSARLTTIPSVIVTVVGEEATTTVPTS